MGESSAKKAACQLLSLIRPLIHRCGGPPSPEGKVKSFPFGRCVAQRIESNIAAGGSYTIKSGAGRAQP